MSLKVVCVLMHYCYKLRFKFFSEHLFVQRPVSFVKFISCRSLPIVELKLSKVIGKWSLLQRSPWTFHENSRRRDGSVTVRSIGYPCLVCPMLPVSLDWQFLIAPPVFSIVYLMPYQTFLSRQWSLYITCM
jgi:hypothetical protein